MIRHLLAALTCTGMLSMPAVAAPLANGSFMAALSGWDTLGDASAEPGRLWLTNASTGQDDSPLPAAALNRSGIGAVTTFDGSAEAFAGLPAGALGVDAFEVSLARQRFDTDTASTISLRWNFLTNEIDASFADYAYVAIDGQLFALGAVVDTTVVGDAGYAWQTGERVAQFQIEAGNHQITLGVVDVGDVTVTSALRVADVQVTPVPEPGAIGLMLAGLGLVAGARRFRFVHAPLGEDA